MTALDRLEATARRQLALFEYPTREWMLPASGDTVDVVVVGAGPRACALALGLRRERIGRIMLIDTDDPDDTMMYAALTDDGWRRADFAGHEVSLGPFSFAAWLRATYASEQALPHGSSLVMSWNNYSQWLRGLLEVTIVPGPSVAEIRLGSGALVRHRGGTTVRARRIVVATREADLPKSHAVLPNCTNGCTVSLFGNDAAIADLALTALSERRAAQVLHCAPTEHSTFAWDDPGLIQAFPRLPATQQGAIVAAASQQFVPPPAEWLAQLRIEPRYRRIDPTAWPSDAPPHLLQADGQGCWQWQGAAGSVPLCSIVLGTAFESRVEQALSLFGTAALPAVGPAALTFNLIRFGLPLLLSEISRGFFLEDQDALYDAYNRYDGLG